MLDVLRNRPLPSRWIRYPTETDRPRWGSPGAGRGHPLHNLGTHIPGLCGRLWPKQHSLNGHRHKQWTRQRETYPTVAKNSNTLKKAEPDFLVGNNGSMVALTPMTPKARKACEGGTITFEDWQVMAGSIMVDHRMADDLLEHLRDDGFIIAEE